jgi:hypothetical protein
MEGLILEVLNRSGAQGEIHKITNFPLRIGRAYDNDIVLNDPFVSPLHLVIEQGETGWIATDQSSTNGTFIVKGRPLTGAVEIESGGQLMVGRSVLRFWAPTHPVAPALPLLPPQSFARRAVSPLLALVAICGTIAFIMFSEFLDTAKQAKPLSLLASALPLCAFPFLWAGIWASAGFIIRRKSRYGLQLIVANGAFILIFIVTVLAEYIDYVTSSVTISDIVQYIAMALLAAVLLFVNIRIATGIADLRRATISLVIGASVIAAIAITDRAQSFENSTTPQYSRTLKPPYAKLAKSVSLDEFIKESEKMFREEKK